MVLAVQQTCLGNLFSVGAMHRSVSPECPPSLIQKRVRDAEHRTVSITDGELGEPCVVLEAGPLGWPSQPSRASARRAPSRGHALLSHAP